MSDDKRIEIRNGDKRAVFLRGDDGWTPDWFYQWDRPMLRFRDHEWLYLGHVHPTAAAEAKKLDDGGVAFSDVAFYGQTRTPWTITVRPDPLGDGFVIECAFTPAESIELLEAYAALESPYDYDGSETATTVIGMNPAVQWKGPERISPPTWNNPAWAYSRPQSVRITAPCDAPLLCQVLAPVDGSPPRHISVVGDWTVCRVRDVYVTPTRDTPLSPSGAFHKPDETRGYKYCVGVLNWSSAYIKDPNFLFEGGRTHLQRLAVNFDTRMPGGTLDTFTYQAWERACAFSFPADGQVEAEKRAHDLGASWQTAMDWMRDIFTGEEGARYFFRPNGGFAIYALGSRPKAWDSYNWGYWMMYGGPMHYRAAMTGDRELADRCDEYDLRLLEETKERPIPWCSADQLPSFWWAHHNQGRGPLAKIMKDIAANVHAESVAENGGERLLDYGSQSGFAEGLMLAGLTFNEQAYIDQALVLIKEFNVRLDENFWSFNGGYRKSLVHGGQIRSHGHGRAIRANLLAYQTTGDEQYRTNAHRFARYLLSLCYASHNSSPDPDFDYRGWCNGSNGGRDQIAEFPPWETTAGMLCWVMLMAEMEVESGFYDATWYLARTGLAQFPAARSLKRIYDQSGQVKFIPRNTLGSERDFYDVLPYLAYENPRDQTLQAAYQGGDCLRGEFVFGNGLARSADTRLGVFVPGAATLDLSELTERKIQLWNPVGEAIDTTVTAIWPGGATTEQDVTVPPRGLVRMSMTP